MTGLIAFIVSVGSSLIADNQPPGNTSNDVYSKEMHALATQLSKAYVDYPNNTARFIQHFYPLTRLKINHALAIQVISYKKVVDRLLVSIAGTHVHLDEFKTYLNNLLDQYHLLDTYIPPHDKEPLSGPLSTWQGAQKEIIVLQQELWRRLGQALEADTITPPSDLNLQIHHGFVNALAQNQSWLPLNKDLYVQLEGHKAQLQTSIIPIKYTNDFFKRLYDADDINGVPSYLKEQTTHAVNVALTELHIDGVLNYRGVRTGVVSVPCITDSKVRAESAMHKGREVLTLALINYLSNIAENKGNPEEVLQEAQASGKAIEFPISSISLLTPIKDPIIFYGPYIDPASITIPYKQPNLSPVSEYDQLRDQIATWRQLAQEGALLKVDWNKVQYTVKVKPTTYLFNFGVSSQALKNDAGLFTQDDGGWKYASEINVPSLIAILGNLNPKQPIGGLVGEYLKDKDLSANSKAQLIQALADQIRTIWSSQSYMLKTDPYKLPLRVIILMYQLGHITIFNCMSGKDRAGMLDTMIKFWMIYYHLTGKALLPEVPFNDDMKQVFTTLAIMGNNIPYQAYNMSLGGSKLYFEGIDPLLEYFISPMARLWYLGGSLVLRGSEGFFALNTLQRPNLTGSCISD
jgi:hypothetical protein